MSVMINGNSIAINLDRVSLDANIGNSLFRKVFLLYNSDLKLYIIHIFIIFIHFQLCLTRSFFCSLDIPICKKIKN